MFSTPPPGPEKRATVWIGGKPHTIEDGAYFEHGGLTYYVFINPKTMLMTVQRKITSSDIGPKEEERKKTLQQEKQRRQEEIDTLTREEHLLRTGFIQVCNMKHTYTVDAIKRV